jgi:hypothetical protein
MRRNIIVLTMAAVMFAGTALAGYPEEYYGQPLPEGCIEIEAWVPAGGFHDMNPWSMPSPEESIIWFGSLCVDDPIAVLEFTQLGGRYCTRSIFNPNIEECYAWVWLTIGVPDRHVMTWQPEFAPDWGFYLTSIFIGEWTWLYDSLTNNGDETMTFIEGAFGYVLPSWFVESDDYTRWRFTVREKQTPAFGYRAASTRRSPGD